MPEPTADRAVTTIAEIRTLPEDGLRHELLDGVHIVTPAPSLPHQPALRELFLALQDAVSDQAQLEASGAPRISSWAPGTLVQPDLFVSGSSREASPAPGRRWASPSSWSRPSPPPRPRGTGAPNDGSTRGPAARNTGSSTWTARLIERWRPEDERPEIGDAILRWTPPDGETSRELGVRALFAAAR